MGRTGGRASGKQLRVRFDVNRSLVSKQDEKQVVWAKSKYREKVSGSVWEARRIYES